MKKNKLMELFETKPIDDLLHDSKQSADGGLKRFLGPFNLIFFGIGAIIGAGIFVLTGSAAANYAGPAIVLSFILAGLASLFAAFCYAEFASLIPISGSAYTYGYTTLGEFFAWIIGWDLILEYALSVATVASGWSGYFLSLLNNLNIYVPAKLTAAPGMVLVKYQGHWHHFERIKSSLETTMTSDQIALLPHMTASFNLMAFLIVTLITCQGNCMKK